MKVHHHASWRNKSSPELIFSWFLSGSCVLLAGFGGIGEQGMRLPQQNLL